MGLGPDVLHRTNPGLIVVRVSGFGQTGPYAELPGFGIPTPLIVSIAVVSTLLIAAITTVALKTRRRAVTSTGDPVGTIAEVVSVTQSESWVRLHGETWRAVSSVPLQASQKVRVIGRKGLVLEVVPNGGQPQGE